MTIPITLTALFLAAGDHLADAEPVLEQIGEGAHPEADARGDPADRAAQRLGPDAAPVEILHESPHRAKLEIANEDGAHGLGLLGYDHELLADAGIAERDRPPDPDAFALGGGDLVAPPLPDHLPLELGEGEQPVERDPPHAGGGIAGLSHRAE